MPTPIPTSSLIFSPQATDFSRTLSSLKRATLSLSNRLRSIAADSSFVAAVAATYGLPLVANERCGGWYVEPAQKAGSAYFKSTDGHAGQWAFSLRRLNVGVFDVLAERGGCVVVDSTRRGKAMPDALMKTVPIWCAVFNRLLFPSDEEAGRLYTPPKCVSKSEHAQIEQRLDGFVTELKMLQLDVAELKSKIAKPLRPLWVTRESELPNSLPEYEDFYPVVLCTASKRVVGGEASEGGYIQGAGDDAESWSHGLTPTLFWQHKDKLLTTSDAELPDLIASYLQDDIESGAINSQAIVIKAAPWLSIGTFGSLTLTALSGCDAVVTVGQKGALPQIELPEKKHLHLECRDRKLGSRDLRTQISQLRPFIESFTSPKRILICENTGKDLAAGVGLALLCLYADEDGQFQSDLAQRNIDKVFIKRHLSWIMTSHQAASPSRTTLQSINDFLLSEHARDLPATFDTLRFNPQADSSISTTEAIFRALQGSWTLERTIDNFRTDGLAGTVSGTATFFAREPTSEDASLEYLYREEGAFKTSLGVEMTINRRWVWRLSQTAAVTEDPSISIHFVKADGETEDYLYNRLNPFSVLKSGRSDESRDGSSDNDVKVLTVAAEHPCGKDFYVSSYDFRWRGARRILEGWDVKHEVKGPAKDYVSTSLHTRRNIIE